jgi:MoxR-like ATPase
MRLKFWVIFDLVDGPTIDPRYKPNMSEVDTKRKIYFSSTITQPTDNCWLLTEMLVFPDKFEIVEIFQTESAEEFPSTETILETIKHNRKIMSSAQNEKVTSKFQRPEDLYITDMNWNLINSTIDLGKYPLLIGPKGCGKTQTAQSIASARGMKYYGINCGAIFKPKATLVGQMQANEGTTYLLESEFLKHFTDDSEQGVLIFLDEISRIPQAAANYFMTILDRIQSYIYVEEQGRQVKRGKNVIFMAAANFGYEYSDTRNLDGALIDRFIKFMIGYLPKHEEIKLIKQRVPKASETDIERLVKYATTCRESDTLRVAVSTRQLLDMADYLPLGYGIKTIFDYIFINLFVNGSSDDRETVEKMFDGIN